MPGFFFAVPGMGRTYEGWLRSLHYTGNALAKIAFGDSFKNIFSVYGDQAVEICTEMSATFTGAASAHHAAAELFFPMRHLRRHIVRRETVRADLASS